MKTISRQRAGLIVLALLLSMAASAAMANDLVVSNVQVEEGLLANTFIVTYDLQTVGGQPVMIRLFLSTDGGENFTFQCQAVSGAVGAGVEPGSGLQIEWNAGLDRPGLVAPECMLRVLADDCPHAEEPFVDASTLTSKAVCGYQGWFNAPGDGSHPAVGWRHWSRSTTDIGPGLYTVDMWPDVSEYDPDELYEAPNVTLLDGSPGRLFSSVHPKTVARHFQWMRTYGIDGVFLQRFVSELGDPAFFDIRNRVLANVRTAANIYGRAFALEYDTSGTPPEAMFEAITSDWRYLVDTAKLLEDSRYLHHNGKPVVIIWGLGFRDRGHTPALASQIINFFKNDPEHGGNYLIGGIPTYWRTLSNDSESDPGWAAVYRSFDAIHPWMVGRFTDNSGIDFFKHNVWGSDLFVTRDLGIDYLPVVWPGFSWDNLTQQPPGTSLIPRNGGDFLWRQIHAFQDLGVDMMFVAMFDEVDESTAIFKVSSNHPITDNWVDYEGLPNDWYLRLVDAASQMLRGEIPLTSTIPISP